MWNTLNTAFSFLTIIRLPFADQGLVKPEQLAASFSFFPLAGLALGLICFLSARALSSFAPPALIAVTITTILAIFTRALHLDGVADLADGLGGGYTPERRLEIMKDSRIGAFGALALILAILLKTAALNAILLKGSYSPLLIAPALSRCAMALAAYKSTYARAEGGLGKPFLEHLTKRHLLTASFISALTLLFVPPRIAIAFALITIASPFFLKRMASAKLGGITGDVLGTVNEATEIALFYAAACM